MIARDPDCERSLRWLIAHRRPNISIDQTVRLLCELLPRDIQTVQLLRRIAEEAQAQEPETKRINWRTPPGLPPRG